MAWEVSGNFESVKQSRGKDQKTREKNSTEKTRREKNRAEKKTRDLPMKKFDSGGEPVFVIQKKEENRKRKK